MKNQITFQLNTKTCWYLHSLDPNLRWFRARVERHCMYGMTLKYSSYYRTVVGTILIYLSRKYLLTVSPLTETSMNGLQDPMKTYPSVWLVQSGFASFRCRPFHFRTGKDLIKSNTCYRLWRKPASTRCFTTNLKFILFLMKQNGRAENIVCNSLAWL